MSVSSSTPRSHLVRGLPDRRRRAVALVAAVVGTVLAASIALLIMDLTLGATRLESRRYDTTLALDEVDRTRIVLEDELAGAPLFFYAYVSDVERARVCDLGDGSTVEPGEVWPVECGTTWSYTDPAISGPVRVELVPPSGTEPRLEARISAAAGGRQIGVRLYYALDSTARYTLAASEDLDLSVIAGGDAASLSGEVYSSGTIALPVNDLDTTLATISAEAGFDMDPELSPLGGKQVRFYGPEDLTGDIAVSEIRDLHPTPLTGGSLQSTYSTLVSLVCNGAEPALVAGLADRFCLRPDSDLVDGAGALTSVPATATSFLLLPSSGGDDLVEVWWSSKRSTAPTTCANPCNPSGASGTALGAGTHPGAISFWTSLGLFPVPTNGVIVVGGDVHIGLCGAGFTGAGCTTWSAPGGVEAKRSLTVLAGTVLEPKDVYLSGPVAVADSVSFGAVASGRVVLPYWATTSAGTASVEGSYTALGAGVEGDSVVTLPETPGASAVAGLTLEGTLAGISVDSDFSLYTTASLSGRDRHYAFPPPLYPSATGTWRRVAGEKYVLAP